MTEIISRDGSWMIERERVEGWQLTVESRVPELTVGS
jgi:hypothetical protein